MADLKVKLTQSEITGQDDTSMASLFSKYQKPLHFLEFNHFTQRTSIKHVYIYWTEIMFYYALFWTWKILHSVLTSSMILARCLLYGLTANISLPSGGNETCPTTSFIPNSRIRAYAILVTCFKSSWAPVNRHQVPSDKQSLLVGNSNKWQVFA